MRFEILTKGVNKNIYLILSLIVTFWMLSLYEVYMTISNGIEISNIGTHIAFKFINDFWTGLIIGLILLPFQLLISFLFKRTGILFFKIIFIIVVISQYALVKYSLTTLLNLGGDLLGYSFNDIKLTVATSKEVSLLSSIQIFIFPVLFIVSYYLLKKSINKSQSVILLLVFAIFLGSFKLVIPKLSEDAYKNKISFLAADIIRVQREKSKINSYNLGSRNDYPFLKPNNQTTDVLSPFFNSGVDKPNIVFLIVEGLGSEFMDDNKYSGFTPFIDSLITKSLYWENFLSTTGRTFGVLPSLMGSLPFGENGFLELKNTPSHISLISVLKANGYTTSFYSGDNSSFDRKINFLEYNGIDNVIDKSKFGNEYISAKENEGGFSWGFPDKEMFKKTLKTFDNLKLPRLDILMTLTNHEPFEFPSKEKYFTKIDSILNSSNHVKIEDEEVNTYKEIFAALLYTDDAIKNFITTYKERPEFNNTIFIITGDHRLIPITQKDKLCRFHVPLLIYSPMLKKAERFKSISSHFNVAPSLLAYLMNNYKFTRMDEISWMGKNLDTAKQFRNIHQIPLMRYKGNINDFVYKEYILSDEKLYEINENMGLNNIIDDQLLKTVSDSLSEFKKLNAYVTSQNKIFPDSLNIYIVPKLEFTSEQTAEIEKLTKDLNFDEIFNLARNLAFDKKYIKARLLCDYILNELPNHADARTLKGRTLAWEGNYEEAEKELLNVIKRAPYYYDCYLALLDLYWWSEKDEKSIEIAKIAYNNELDNSEISFKLAKAYQRLNNTDKAIKIMDSLVNLYPENITYQSYKQSLN
ncbi:sulfatase-like hydrolase/transferase [uncultured Lutibacter sp.]|uniref:sulfatase-like hydrolase/transferase n=1 Tax=uncultured Lutibacter sp. TaxID=437739 RepID=UPI0026116971|nr:sulfatase-like hydrolase/transferase [uncultured Lutibacter sp.]